MTDRDFQQSEENAQTSVPPAAEPPATALEQDAPLSPSLEGSPSAESPEVSVDREAAVDRDSTVEVPLASEVAPPLPADEASSQKPREDAAAPQPAIEHGWLASVQSLVVTVAIAVFVITFIVQAFQIPSESMENTLLIGDYLLVDKAHYGPKGTLGFLLPYQKIQRGDIIVFRYPVHPSEHFVKRVIGLPGDRVRLIRRRVFINGQPLDERYVIRKENGFDPYRDNFPAGSHLSPHITSAWYMQMLRMVEDGELIVPEGMYFVLGDNRDQSLDSRYWGFVPQENVIGRPLLIYWSAGADSDGDVSQEILPANDRLSHIRSAVVNVFRNIRWHRVLRVIH